jgi:hypothetical protein
VGSFVLLATSVTRRIGDRMNIQVRMFHLYFESVF